MTASTSPNSTATPVHPDDEDRVVFKSSPPPVSSNLNGQPQKALPAQVPAPVGTGSKRSSLGVIAPQQPPYSPSPLLLGGDVGNGSGDQTSWDLSERLMQMQLNPSTSKEAVFPNLNDGLGMGMTPSNSDGSNGSSLAPPADLTSEKQPHSRQSSNGTAASSVQDSPTVPTPAQAKPGQSQVAGKPYVGAGNVNDGYGLDPYAAYNGLGGEYAGGGGRAGHPGGAHFSPINGSFNGIVGQPAQLQAAQQPHSQFGFGFHNQPQTHELSFSANAMSHNGAQSAVGGAGTTYNAQQQRANAVAAAATLNTSGFAPYGSPPPPNGYGAAGMMSPTLASPTFLPAGLNPYASPVIPPQTNPYGAYAGAGFEMPPGSPVLSSGAAQSAYNAAAAAGATGVVARQPPFTPPPNQYGRGRGQGMQGSGPGAAMRGGASPGGGPTTPGRAGRGARGRGGGTQVMMTPSAYSVGSPYGPPMSPTPYDSGVYGAPTQAQGGSPAAGGVGGGPQSPQVFQPQATNPELASLMLQMAAAGYQQGMMSPYALANGGPGVGANGMMNPNFMGMGMGMGMAGIGFNAVGGAGVGAAGGAGMVRPDWMDAATWDMAQAQSSGPSANNRKLGLYKTELCRSFEEKGECRYGDKCQFAHGDAEQRKVERHPKYKTEICRTFWVSGSCPYGKRCCFIHTELPTNAAANGGGSGAPEGPSTPSGAQNGANSQAGDTRNRSMSTNSDPNDPPSSLLARISAKAQANSIARSSEAASPANNSSGGSANSGQPTEAVVAAAINRAMAKFGAPDPSVTVLRKIDTHPTPPPPAEVVPMPKVPAVFSSFPVGNSSSPTSAGGLGGHHRMSASVDFGRVSRNLGSDLAAGFGGGGHARNPSASSVVPNSLLSRTPNPPLSGHSTPYGSGSTSNGISSNGIQPSTLLDRTWA